MTVTAERRDTRIKRDVLNELEWDPRVDIADVGVEVHDGFVTLTGRVGNFAKKLAAQEAAHRVNGVLDVANDIEVVVPGLEDEFSDEEIARAVRHALVWDAHVPDESIQSTVTSGWVALTGTVDTITERNEAGRAIQRLRGVVGVSNDISVKERIYDEAWVRRSIEDALDRLAHIEAEQLSIGVKDNIIRIEGKVRSRTERNAVLEAVSCAPGVTAVEEHLLIDEHI